MRKAIFSFRCLICITLGVMLTAASLSAQQERPNVLFIIVDDLNTTITAYGHENMVTPNIDNLADQGTLFERAYTQQPVCSASRASFLTGLRPETAGVNYPYSEYFVQEVLPKHPTVSAYFKSHGYYTRHFGKVHHGQDLDSLSAPWFQGNAQTYFNPENAETKDKSTGGPPFEASRSTIEVHRDALIANEAMSALEAAATKDQPFFFAVGFHKPHLPFVAPKQFYDLYPVEKVPLPECPLHPLGAPDWTIDRYVLDQYKWEHNDRTRPFSAQYTREARQAYYACVSFIDHLVGDLVSKADELNLLDNTIIVITSDHGFHLGDQNHWSKTTNYESALHVPLIIVDGRSDKHGLRSKAFVELVDMYPTLVELCGLPMPDYLEGTSVVPLLDDPDRPWKSAAFTRQPRGMLDHIYGHAIRTDRYRYVEWTREATGEVLLQELYDYEKDAREIENLADHAEYKSIRDELAERLAQGWKAALPPGIENHSDNPIAPPPYAVRGEGMSRREAWVREYGGNVDMNWEEAARVRREAEAKGQMP